MNINHNKTDEEIDAEMMAFNPDTDWPEPPRDLLFGEYYHMLWEMRNGFQADPLKSFERNLNDMIKFNYRRNTIKTILDIKSEYFHSTQETI